MLDMNVVGWIVVGFLAGAISGALVGGSTARGCLPNIVVGILGGLVGGWLATQLGFSEHPGLHRRGRRRRVRVGRHPPGPQRDQRPLTARDVGPGSRSGSAPRSPRATLVVMTDASMPERRPYSPGLEGIVAGETSLGYVDGERGQLLYRGYRDRRPGGSGRVPAVANLLWTSSGMERPPAHGTRPGPGHDRPASPTGGHQADGRAPDGGLGLGRDPELPWPPTAEQARALTSFSPSALAAFARLRAGEEPVEPDGSLDLVEGFLYQLTGERRTPPARALDGYFIVGSEHGFNASTFTAGS